MIGLIFRFGTDIVEVRIDGHQVLFRSSGFGSQFATIEGLKLSYQGVIKEFPELIDNPNWKIEAIAKFKDKIKELNDEKLITKYVEEDLSKFGYTLVARGIPGHRIQKVS